jgi:hypothetical protein
MIVTGNANGAIRLCGSSRFCCVRQRLIPPISLRAMAEMSLRWCLRTPINHSAVVRAERLRASIAEADFSGLHAHGSGGEEVKISVDRRRVLSGRRAIAQRTAREGGRSNVSQ